MSKYLSSIHKIRFNDESWEDSTWGQKDYVCFHILILANTLRIISFTIAEMKVPLGPRPKRGREPTKMSKNYLAKPAEGM